MTEEKPDLVARAEAALSGLSLREPDWEAFANRIEGAASGTASDDPALFDAPLPRGADDGEAPVVTAPADDSVPAPRDSGIVAAPADSRREGPSLAELARASVARRGHAEKASIAKESLAVASQSRALGEQIAQRVQAAASSPQAAAVTPSAPPPPPSARPVASTRPSDVFRGPWPGIVIGGIALAAAFALFVNRPDAPAPVTIIQPAPPVPAAPRAETPTAEAPRKSEASPPTPAREAALDPTSLPALPREPAARSAASTAAAEAPAVAKAQTAAPAPAGGGKVAAEKIVLEDEGKAAKPAGGDAKLRPAELSSSATTDRPSAGAAQAAVGAVLGAARACVAGHPQPSSAQIVFGSDGQVSTVSVSGPAAGTPASACIESALKKARVQPFAASSFSLGVTIRPP